MAKQRKNKPNTPRHKRMKRSQRLEAAKEWLSSYEGKRLVRGYSRHFDIDKYCAAKDLEMLGYTIDSNYKKRLKKVARKKHREHKKQKKLQRERELEAWLSEDSDETFAYIAGYTSGGAPYGITWEEMREIEEREKERKGNINENGQSSNIVDDDLPF